jgi:hypothetical protein
MTYIHTVSNLPIRVGVYPPGPLLCAELLGELPYVIVELREHWACLRDFLSSIK